MNFHKFSKLIISNKDAGSVPGYKLYPADIKLDSRIWSYILDLYNYTSQYNYEHSITLYWLDGDIIATSPTKGSKTHVTTREKVNLSYKPKIRDWYEKIVTVNGRAVLKKQVKADKIPEEIRIVQLFNVHSHPGHRKKEKLNYSFFSGTDINTLACSSSLCMGLVTDEFLLVCKSDVSPTILTDSEKLILNKINQHYFHSKTIPSEIASDSSFIFYRSDFKQQLKKIS